MNKQKKPERVTLDALIAVDGKPFVVGDLRYEDVHLRHMTGRAVLLRCEGRHKEYGYRHGCMTNIGDVDDGMWREIVKCLINDKYHEEVMFEHMLEWITEKSPWLKDSAERELQALDGIACRLFNNELWICFIPFNERYRPSALDGIATIEIIPECCNIPGKITKTRFEYDIAHDASEMRTFCPHCGRWTRIRLA